MTEHHQQQGAHRNVQKETPAPAEVFSQRAAQHRAQQRPEQNDQAEYRHTDGHLMARQAGRHQHLRRGDHGASREALAESADDHLRQGFAEAAQDRKQAEQHRVANQKIAQPEHPCQPGGQRDHDNFSHQIAGGNPRAFSARGANLALNLRQGGVGDGDVQRGHQRTQCAGEDNDPVAGAGVCPGREQRCGGSRRVSHDGCRRRP